MPKASRSNRAPSVGIDIVEIHRVEKLAKRNKKFLKRVFSDEEIRYCSARKLKWQHFAVRFAAKEAVWKALGKPALAITDISIRHRKDGGPYVVVRGKEAKGVSVSLTHSEEYAAAVAVAA